MTTLKQSLRSYVESHYPIIHLVAFEEEKIDGAIRDLAGDRKILEWNMARGCVRHENKAPVIDRYIDLPAALDNWLDQELDNHFLIVRNAGLALRDAPLAIARLEALAHRIVREDSMRATVFLVAPEPCVPPELEKFITPIDLPPPDEKEIEGIVRRHAEEYGATVAEKTIGRIVPAFRGLSEYEIVRLLNRGYQRDGEIGADDVELVIEEKRQIVRKSGILEMISATETMTDVGGLAALKRWLERKAKIMSDLAAAQEFGVDAPRGAMIVGPPGCGKSLAARAAANLFGVPLLRLDVGSLMGRYVGESEANMRRALRLAETVSPCVLWVDELEKAFAGIGGGAVSSGMEITHRLFGYFLTWMQENTKSVFVMATVNDISSLPPELLRKGRFDEIFHVGFPTAEERKEILRVHLKKRGGRYFKYEGIYYDLAKKTKAFSGADLEGVVKDAIEDAFLEDKALLNRNHLNEAVKKHKPRVLKTKEKLEEYRDKIEEMGIRSASDE